MSKGAASSMIVVSPNASRDRMALLVGSASAANAEFRSVDITEHYIDIYLYRASSIFRSGSRFASLRSYRGSAQPPKLVSARHPLFRNSFMWLPDSLRPLLPMHAARQVVQL